MAEMIGERIRQTRQARRLSLNDVSERAKISVATLSRIERDKQGLELGLFLTLCRILKSSPQDFLGTDAPENVDPLALKIAGLQHTERVQLWRDLAVARRGEKRHAMRTQMRKLADEVEELLAQLEELVAWGLDRRGGPVLDGVSFEARRGETLAIVGPSGSGKSTIADLLLRLLDPDAGTVRLDGIDVREFRLDDLRRAIVLVDQEPFVFHTSIAENLRYARPEASQRELENAARAAGIDDFIRGLPLGYETEVGERGTALSAGERQRLAIARAFLADPAVLVLDEPTASLDPTSERHVIAGYEAIMRGRTTILITHRLELAMQADRVVVLDGARVVEAGMPEELLARRAHFATLFATAAAR